MTKTIINLKQVIEMLKNDMTRFYGVGFKATLEQIVVIYPSIDLSQINPSKVVVDGKLA